MPNQPFEKKPGKKRAMAGGHNSISIRPDEIGQVDKRGDTEALLFLLRKEKVDAQSKRKAEGLIRSLYPGAADRKRRWTRGDSNPQPPACEADALPLRYLPLSMKEMKSV